MQGTTPRPRSVLRAKRARTASPEERPPAFRNRLLPVLLVLPTLSLFALFAYWPAVETLLLSLYRSNTLLGTRRWIGADNFRELFSSPAYLQVLGQTLAHCALVVIVGLLVSLGLAWLASAPVRGAHVYRMLLIFPFALSPAIAGAIWLFVFSPQIGILDQVISGLLRTNVRWLEQPLPAFLLVTAAIIWKSLGYNILFYLAAIQNLPREVLEAAEIDGATPRQVFWKVVVPLLSPITFFLAFTNVVGAIFGSFPLVDVLTSGGPFSGNAGATTFLAYQFYQDGFRNFRVDTAAAQAIVMLTLVIGVTWLQFRYGNRRVTYGA